MYCDVCGKSALITTIPNDDLRICPDCFHKLYKICSICGYSFHSSSKQLANEYTCLDCHNKKNKIINKVVDSTVKS